MAGNQPDPELHREQIEQFTTLFAANQRQLHIYITGLVFSPSDAYDILQDTNLVLWENFETFEIGTNFLAWARKIAFHRVLRFRDSKVRRTAIIDPHLLESFAAKSSEQSLDLIEDRQEALKGCLQKLRNEDRVLIERRYKSTTSVKGMAEELGRSENGISQSLRRIRKALKECITQSLRSGDAIPSVQN